MAHSSAISEFDILAEIIGAHEGNWSPELANLVLGWKFSRKTAKRIDALAQCNRNGRISDSDREELQRYLRVGNFINVMQAKARLILQPT